MPFESSHDEGFPVWSHLGGYSIRDGRLGTASAHPTPLVCTAPPQTVNEATDSSCMVRGGAARHHFVQWQARAGL